ncbi:MAG TPA: glycosyltransferase family 9 protein [Flavobacterium sp.]|nr:glycosyltransferase family 9 protein [Flavobacterium sp.]
MTFFTKVNNIRRQVMHLLTSNIGHSHRLQAFELIDTGNIKRILVCRPNHRLGNLLLITPLLQELIATFPDCKIDLFVKGTIAPELFCNYDNIDTIIQLPRKPFKELLQYCNGWLKLRTHHYDLVVNVDRHSSSGRLSTKFSRGTYKLFGDSTAGIASRYADYKHFAKSPVYDLRYSLSQLGFGRYEGNIPPLSLKLSPSEINSGKKILTQLAGDKDTICLFTYGTGDKCYSESWWHHFYHRLKNEYPDHQIVEVLPLENISKIDFKAPAFYSKSVREIGSVIANAKMFIGADSGIMHLASAVQTPTIGLFSVTNAEKYMPYSNDSVAINTNNSSTDNCMHAINHIIRRGYFSKPRQTA